MVKICKYQKSILGNYKLLIVDHDQLPSHGTQLYNETWLKARVTVRFATTNYLESNLVPSVR